MSLRWRIMGPMVLVIVLTVLISVGVGYYATQSRLGVFVEEIGVDEAGRLARNLSREYTAAGGWETVDEPLSEAGYIYDGVSQRERPEGSEEGHDEFLHQDQIRVVITDVDGRVLKDNLSELPPGTAAPDLDGHRETVLDLSTDQPVGHVYVDVNREFLSAESHGFLSTLLEASSIHELLTAETDRWQPQSQARQVALSMEASPDLPDMDLDWMRMSQALGNLLSNAIRCTEAGGSIVLRAALEGDEALTIAVIDDGIGIDAADLPHVFDRFYRTDQSRSRGIGGTGLGLAITRAIVEAHGGTIVVASDGLGQGVTVTVRLPLNKRE